MKCKENVVSYNKWKGAQEALNKSLSNEMQLFEKLCQTWEHCLYSLTTQRNVWGKNIAKFNYNVELILENHVYPAENCCLRKADVEVEV